MKTITVSLDLKSSFLGTLTLGGILMMTNFTPANKSATVPNNELGRWQAVTYQNRIMILDTKTGAYMYDRGVGNRLRRIKSGLDSTQSTDGK